MLMFTLQLELFWPSYLVGAALSVLLAHLGLYLRLRREYWAALAYGQVGAAGALGALAWGFPALSGGLAASLAVAGLKHRLERRLPAASLFPLLFLLGWGMSLLMTARLPAVERLGQALFEGQLYFVGRAYLPAALFALAVSAGYLRRHGRSLLLFHLYPGFFQARGLPAWPAQIGFDLIATAALALAVMCLGVMGAFALVFIPPWLVFTLARTWRVACVIAPVLAFLAYSLAFALALYGDLPFGPTLALTLALAALVFGGRRPDDRAQTFFV
jgi:zinc transport system permease protein